MIQVMSVFGVVECNLSESTRSLSHHGAGE